MNKLSYAGILLVILIGIGFTVLSYQNEQVHEVTVVDKEVKNTSESSTYLVFTEVD